MVDSEGRAYGGSGGRSKWRLKFENLIPSDERKRSPTSPISNFEHHAEPLSGEPALMSSVLIKT